MEKKNYSYKIHEYAKDCDVPLTDHEKDMLENVLTDLEISTIHKNKIINSCDGFCDVFVMRYDHEMIDVAVDFGTRDIQNNSEIFTEEYEIERSSFKII